MIQRHLSAASVASVAPCFSSHARAQQTLIKPLLAVSWRRSCGGDRLPNEPAHGVGHPLNQNDETLSRGEETPDTGGGRVFSLDATAGLLATRLRLGRRGSSSALRSALVV